MAKLYFKYGAMGSSKSAQALITKFNYEELGMTVWLIKPSIDTRDGADLIRSRIGLECRARVITPTESIIAAYREEKYQSYGKTRFAEAARAAVLDMKEDIKIKKLHELNLNSEDDTVKSRNVDEMFKNRRNKEKRKHEGEM